MNRNALSIAKLGLVLLIMGGLSVIFSTSCGTKSLTTSTTSLNPTTTQNTLNSIQQNGNLSVRFYGVMTFEFSGTQVSSPSELAVAGVPITWMGLIFNGTLEEKGAGEDITDVVHGSISPDGNWVETMYYSRQILRKTVNSSGTFYRITLTKIPLSGNTTITPVVTTNTAPSVTAPASPAGLGTFQITGSDVQKYITKIEYADGPMAGSQIQSTTKYVTTDWKNIGVGQVPSLRLIFALGSGNAGLTPTIPGMMGQ
jgi:hypothetical protein